MIIVEGKDNDMLLSSIDRNWVLTENDESFNSQLADLNMRNQESNKDTANTNSNQYNSNAKNNSTIKLNQTVIIERPQDEVENDQVIQLPHFQVQRHHPLSLSIDSSNEASSKTHNNNNREDKNDNEQPNERIQLIPPPVKPESN